jgi:pantoate--beta-alanine ligase
MEVVHTIKDVRNHVNAAKKAGKKVGFVPTMGFLHLGHLSLVEVSKQHSQYQVMSIFVNRIQFNDPDDFSGYPKDLVRDMELAEKTGVDLLFIPDENEMYHDNLTFVDVKNLTENLCGACRPGHFKGVFTVVSKFLNIVQPDVSVFGQKDIQQAVSLEKMALDLNFPVRMIIAPIVREADGLAMSSRNKHLDPEERERALALSRSLKRAEELLQSGQRKSADIAKEMEAVLLEGKPEKIDYISIVGYHDLQRVEAITGKSVIAVAAFIGTTRLIDNMIIDLEGGEARCVY